MLCFWKAPSGVWNCGWIKTMLQLECDTILFGGIEPQECCTEQQYDDDIDWESKPFDRPSNMIVPLYNKTMVELLQICRKLMHHVQHHNCRSCEIHQVEKNTQIPCNSYVRLCFKHGCENGLLLCTFSQLHLQVALGLTFWPKTCNVQNGRPSKYTCGNTRFVIKKVGIIVLTKTMFADNLMTKEFWQLLPEYTDPPAPAVKSTN